MGGRLRANRPQATSYIDLLILLRESKLAQNIPVSNLATSDIML